MPDFSYLARGVQAPEIPDPLRLATQGLTLAQLADSNMMRRLAMEVQQRKNAQEDAYQQAYPELLRGGFSPEAMASALGRFPAAAIPAEAAREKYVKSTADLAKADAEVFKDKTSKQLEMYSQMAGGLAEQVRAGRAPQKWVNSFMTTLADQGLGKYLPAPPLGSAASADPAAMADYLQGLGNLFFSTKDRIAADLAERKFGQEKVKDAAQIQRWQDETKIGLGNLDVNRGELGVKQGQLGLAREQYNRPNFQHATGMGGSPLSFDPKSGAFGNAVDAAGNPLPKQVDPKQVEAIRKEVNGLQDVQNYRAAIPMLNSAQSAPDTPAGDLDVIYAVGKALDPNSVVREGELSLVIKSGSPAQVVQGYANYVMGGGRLSPAQRAELMTMLRNRVGQLGQMHSRALEPYRRQIRDQGLPEDQILIDPGTVGASAPSPKGWGQVTKVNP